MQPRERSGSPDFVDNFPLPSAPDLPEVDPKAAKRKRRVTIYPDLEHHERQTQLQEQVLDAFGRSHARPAPRDRVAQPDCQQRQRANPAAFREEAAEQDAVAEAEWAAAYHARKTAKTNATRHYHKLINFFFPITNLDDVRICSSRANRETH